MSVLDLPSRFEGDESGTRGSAESMRGDVVGGLAVGGGRSILEDGSWRYQAGVGDGR